MSLKEETLRIRWVNILKSLLWTICLVLSLFWTIRFANWTFKIRLWLVGKDQILCFQANVSLYQSLAQWRKMMASYWVWCYLQWKPSHTFCWCSTRRHLRRWHAPLCSKEKVDFRQRSMACTPAHNRKHAKLPKRIDCIICIRFITKQNI